MPALSPTMTAGNIGTWQKQPGDTISPGDVLVEIETDKAQMDFEFQEDGVLAKILKQAGEKDVAVGNVCTPLFIDNDESAPLISHFLAHCHHRRRRNRYFRLRILLSRRRWW